MYLKVALLFQNLILASMKSASLSKHKMIIKKNRTNMRRSKKKKYRRKWNEILSNKHDLELRKEKRNLVYFLERKSLFSSSSQKKVKLFRNSNYKKQLGY